MARKAPGQMERVGDASVATVGDRRFVRMDFKVNGLSVQGWNSIQGDRVVVVRIYAQPGRPSSWEGLEERVVSGLAKK